MGLRDWVSEKVGEATQTRPGPSGFNGAPRLGLGEGVNGTGLTSTGTLGLQWGSETGSRRRAAKPLRP